VGLIVDFSGKLIPFLKKGRPYNNKPWHFM